MGEKSPFPNILKGRKMSDTHRRKMDEAGANNLQTWIGAPGLKRKRERGGKM